MDQQWAEPGEGAGLPPPPTMTGRQHRHYGGVVWVIQRCGRFFRQVGTLGITGHRTSITRAMGEGWSTPRPVHPLRTAACSRRHRRYSWSCTACRSWPLIPIIVWVDPVLRHYDCTHLCAQCLCADSSVSARSACPKPKSTHLMDEQQIERQYRPPVRAVPRTLTVLPPLQPPRSTSCCCTEQVPPIV